MVRKIDLTVTGVERMHCSGCETRVRLALLRREGVQDVLADAKTQHIAVVIDPDRVNVDEVQRLLQAAGFDTTLAPA